MLSSYSLLPDAMPNPTLEHVGASSQAGPARARRCRTVGHTPIPQRPTEPLNKARSNTSTAAQLASTSSQDSSNASQPHGLGLLACDSVSSPSKRGETSRAYSRQRRIFSTVESDASPSRSDSPLLSFGPRPAKQSREVSCERKSSQDAASRWCPTSVGGATLADDAESSAATTPSLISPSSAISRSASLKSERKPFDEYRCISIVTDLAATSSQSRNEVIDSGMEWSKRARRWSHTMSRKVNIAALNQTLHSTTSPFLRAGMQELRSIFDVDTLGLDEDPFTDEDLELASPKLTHHRPSAASVVEEDRQGLSGWESRVLANAEAGQLFASPGVLSPDPSRQSCSEDRSDGPFDAQFACKSPTDTLAPRATAVRRQSTSSTSTLSATSSCMQTVRAVLEPRVSTVRPAHVAVYLAALSIIIVALCVLETTLHPDVASMPLAVFMLAQPAFALLGIVSLAVQKRWLMDLSSRLVRAHVLGQTLIALAAIRSLSGSAFYANRRSTSSTGFSRMLFKPSDAMDAHATHVGSLSDQLTYLAVIFVQAALPLALTFWAQYAIASSLSRVSRLPSSTKNAATAPSAAVPASPRGSRSRGSIPASSPIPERKRVNSENAQSSHNLSFPQRNSEPWLGFKVTRLDTRPRVPTCHFQLDAHELSKRLERFGFDARPLPPLHVDAAMHRSPALTVSA